MQTRSSRTTALRAIVGAVILSAASLDTRAVASPRSPKIGSSHARTSRPDLSQHHCVGSHHNRLKTDGLVLEAIDTESLNPHAEIWEKVVRKLRAGLMPPPGRPRPDRASIDQFTTTLENDLDRVAAAHPDPGRTEPFHRLNRAEYQNAVRDLLGLEYDVSELLPPDDASYGFDNIAGILKTSPTLLERYLTAAERVSRLAVGRPLPSPHIETFTVRDDYPQDQRLEGLPFGTRGGARLRHTFPL